jgi:hypothetical protein
VERQASVKSSGLSFGDFAGDGFGFSPSHRSLVSLVPLHIRCRRENAEIQRTERPMKHNPRTIFRASTIAILTTVVLIGCGQSSAGEKVGNANNTFPTGANAQSRSSPTAGQLPLQRTNLLSFILLKDGSYEDARTAKVIWAILVPSDVTRESLTNLLNDLYSQAQSRKFKQHAAATVIDIKAFMTRPHAESGMGQWIGWMSKSGWQSQPSLSLDERQINQLGKKAEEKFGLSEAKRKEIWQDTIYAEDRANKEAEQKHPEPSPQNRDAFMAAFEKKEKLRKELLNVYRDELAKKYSITRTQLTEITREGVQKSWAFPK